MLWHGLSAAAALLTGLMSLVNCFGEDLCLLHDLVIPAHCLMTWLSEWSSGSAGSGAARCEPRRRGLCLPRRKQKAAARPRGPRTQRWACWRQRLLGPRDGAEVSNHEAVCITEVVCIVHGRSWLVLRFCLLPQVSRSAPCSGEPACLISPPPCTLLAVLPSALPSNFTLT